MTVERTQSILILFL